LLKDKVSSTNKRTTTSRRSLNLGGGALANDALQKKKEKYEADKVEKLRKAKKRLTDQLSKAKKAHKAAGVAARRTNRLNKKAVGELESKGLPVLLELRAVVRDPEKEPTDAETDALLPNPSLQQEIDEIEREQMEEIPIDPALLFGLPNPTAPKAYISDIEEGDNDVVKQVDIGSKGAGLIRGDMMDLDADFVIFGF
jgi:hypothetical protein